MPLPFRLAGAAAVRGVLVEGLFLLLTHALAERLVQPPGGMCEVDKRRLERTTAQYFRFFLETLFGVWGSPALAGVVHASHLTLIDGREVVQSPVSPVGAGDA